MRVRVRANPNPNPNPSPSRKPNLLWMAGAPGSARPDRRRRAATSRVAEADSPSTAAHRRAGGGGEGGADGRWQHESMIWFMICMPMSQSSSLSHAPSLTCARLHWRM